MYDYRKLDVWKVAHALVLDVYRSTARYPPDERYGLTSQTRRAAASVAANLAEGIGRNTAPQLAQFCSISLGSLTELDYHLLLARDLGYLTDHEYPPLATRVAKLQVRLSKFIAAVRTNR